MTSSMIDFIKLITVEPTLSLFMLAFMITSVVEQAFFVDVACRINHQLNDTICMNLSNYKNYEKSVQITVSNFHLYNDIGGYFGQIILALFLGAWSDKRGRKIPLIIGLFGKLYYSLMIIVNSLNNWPLEYIVYTATLPMAFTGADVAIFAAAYTYLIDVTTEKNRTIRVTLLEVCYLATMPIGVALGSFIFIKLVNRSYSIMFSINAILLIISIIYSALRLNWRTNDQQKPLSEATNLITDFFDYNHVLNTGKTLIKYRPNNGRSYLLILIIMMGFYTFQRDERPMSYLYTRLVLHWKFEDFSNFRTFLSAIQVIILLTGVPLMSKVLEWRDTVIIMIGALAHASARIFFATAHISEIFYIGGVLAAIGPIVAPVIRSLVSKLITNTEKGKIFSVLSVTDNAITLLSGVAYSKLYNATIHTNPNAIFYLTMSTQLIVFILVAFIHLTATDQELIYEEKAEGTNRLNSNSPDNLIE